jgi:hypothetical protein
VLTAAARRGGEGAVEDALDSWQHEQDDADADDVGSVHLADALGQVDGVHAVFYVELVGRDAAGELVGVVVVGHYEGRVEEVGAGVLFQHDLSRIEAEGSLKVGRPELRRISPRAFSIATGINTSENRSTIQDFCYPKRLSCIVGFAENSLT